MLCCTFGCRKRYQLVLFVFLFTITALRTWAISSVTLAWDPNTETDLAGYKVYYGTTTGVYTNATDVGNSTTKAITDLADGVQYFFAVTAYNTAGAESDYSAEISYTPFSTNQVPTVSSIPNQQGLPGVALIVPFTVGDAETPADNLSVMTFFSNSNLLAGFTLSGIGSNRLATLVPAIGQAGSSSVTVWVSDGIRSNSSSFILSVLATNTAPFISSIPTQTTLEDVTTAAIPFTVGDAETAAANLSVTAASSNPSLLPSSGITLGGSGSSRTIVLRPAPNQSGTANVTVTTSDGQLSASVTFQLVVNAVNDTPSISSVPNQTFNEDTASPVLAFVVGDLETPAANLAVTASSSSQAVMPTSGIRFGGSASNRTVQLFPATNQFGSATITLSVGDGALTSTSSFLVTVNPVNDAPKISGIPAQTVNEDTATAQLTFTVSDTESAAANLTVSGTSSNPGLVPVNAITFGGSGSNRTVRVLPATNQSGTATITLLVSDGNLSTYSSFVLTVNPVNDVPSISTLKDMAIQRATSTGPITFVIGDAETPASSLSLAGLTSNSYLVPQSSIIFGGSGSNRTVTINPYRKRTGTAKITVSASDDILTTSNSFVLTVSTSGLAEAAPVDAYILAADLFGSSVTVSWATTPGSTYRLLSSTSLSATNWVRAASDITAAGPVTSWTGAVTNGDSRFYRVQRVQ